MGKHLDALKSFDEFRAPWETEGGSDAEIDKPKLKRWIHGILTDKAKAQDAREDVAAELETAKKDLDTAKDEAANANGEDAQKKIDKLQKKVDDLTADIEKRDSDAEAAQLRADVIGNLDPKYAKYVKGETREELEKSLEGVKEDFGIEDEPNDDDDPKVRNRPRTKLTSVTDPDAVRRDDGEIDADKVADAILSGGSVFH